MTTRFRSFAAAVGVLAVAAAGLTVSGAAQARNDVSWSIGLSAPGAAVVVGNGQRYYAPQPVYVQPAPIYSQPIYAQPQPIYYAPQPVYVQPRPVYIQAPPVYVAPRPIYVQPGRGWHHGPQWHDGHRGDWRR